MHSLKEGFKAILLMGGTGERFGNSLPKQFHPIAGKKVYLHTLETFLSIDLFEEILLVCPQKWLSLVEEEVRSFPTVRVVKGGETRQESSLLGLKACSQKTKYVVIHDAVRPFVSKEIVMQNIFGAVQHGAVDTCIPSLDTLIHAPSGNIIESIPKRSDYMRGQTPQSFSYDLILGAHKRAQHIGWTNATDDCQLVLDLSHPIHVVLGDEYNIKITTELDLFLAEQIIRLRKKAIQRSNQAITLKGKRYAITGGTGGIGQALAKLLKKEGAIPIIISRNATDFQADLCNPKDTQKIFEKIHSQYGPIDGLINSMGILKVKEIEKLSPEEVNELISSNFTSLVYCCQNCKLQPEGHIINIASSSYSRGRKDIAIYSSAKAAVVNLTQALAEEKPKLKVNSIVPQRTNTPMRRKAFPEESTKELLSPTKVAKEIIDLLKDNETTGSIIEVKR